MTQPDKAPELKFAEELLAVFVRWYEESDLDELEMAEAATIVINKFCADDRVIFEPDFEITEDDE